MNKQLLGESWYELLKNEMEKEYFKKLKEELTREYNTYLCHPKPHDIFKVFQLCPLEKVRVVMLSQDPYANGNHANGIAFSSQQKDTPYSLQMILREVDRDITRTNDYKEFKQAFPNNDLTPWVEQGVFLLNTVLTVRSGMSNSHASMGWQEFTLKVLELIALDPAPKAFVILGGDAKSTLQLLEKGVDLSTHKILESGHPASGAHGKDRFSGCNFASKVNRWFKQQGLPTIEWRLANTNVNTVVH